MFAGAPFVRFTDPPSPHTQGKIFQLIAMGGSALGLVAAPLAVAAGAGPAGLTAIYFGMGLLCGPQHPTAGKLCADWVLPSERSWASSVSMLSSTLGSLLSSFAVPQLATLFGWQGTFFGLAAVTWVFVVAFALVVVDDPDTHPSLPDAEKRKLREALAPSAKKSTEAAAAVAKTAVESGSTATSSSSSSSSMAALLTCGPACATYIAHAMYNNFRYTLSAWMPSYYNDVLHVDPQLAGAHLGILEFVGAGTNIALKGPAEWAVASGRLTHKVRE